MNDDVLLLSAVVTAFVICLLVATLVAVIGFAAYLAFFSPRISTLSTMLASPLVYTFLSLLASELIRFTSLVTRGANTIYERLFRTVVLRWRILLGVLLASYLLIYYTEYHDLIIQTLMSFRQCVLMPILYDFRLASLVNLGGLLYSSLWGVLVFAGRIGTFATRGLPLAILKCAAPTIIGAFLNVSNGIVLLASASTGFLTQLASVSVGPGEAVFDATAAYGQFAIASTRITQSIVNCSCERLDFIGVISTDWMTGSSTSSGGVGAEWPALLNELTAILPHTFIRLPLRVLTGTNPGTRPIGEMPLPTQPYGVVPNLEYLFDHLDEATRRLGNVLNVVVQTATRELVGEFGQGGTLTPTEQALVDTDWAGVFAEAARSLIAFWRHLYRLSIGVVLWLVDQIANFLGLGGLVSAQITCDMREWRAILDLGGAGSVYAGVDTLDGGKDIASRFLSLTNKLSPYFDVFDETDVADDVTLPALRSLVSATTGTFNFLVRLVLHSVDSERRMYATTQWPRPAGYTSIKGESPVTPLGTTGQPLGASCSAFTQQPGNLLVFVQNYVQDPLGSHLQLVNNLDDLIDGVDDTTDFVTQVGLAEPLGSPLAETLRIFLYAYDVLVQVVSYVNVAFGGTAVEYSQYVSRLRANRLIQRSEEIGDAFADVLEGESDVACTTPDASATCALANVVRKALAIPTSFAVQIESVVNNNRQGTFTLPNFENAIEELAEAVKSLWQQLALLVPNTSIGGGDTLRSALVDLADAPRIIIESLFKIPNYGLYTLATEIDYTETNTALFLTDVGDWFTAWLAQSTTLLADLWDAVVLIAEFVDRILGTDPLWADIARSFREAFDLVVNFVDDDVVELLGILLNFAVKSLNLFFQTGAPFSDRLSDWFDALRDVVNALISLSASFLVDFFFEIIEVILPPPLDAIVSSVANALRFGLCTTIQFFISTAIDVLNFFGADLDEVDLNCGTKRKRDGSADENGHAEAHRLVYSMAKRTKKGIRMSRPRFDKKVVRAADALDRLAMRNGMPAHNAERTQRARAKRGAHTASHAGDGTHRWPGENMTQADAYMMLNESLSDAQIEMRRPPIVLSSLDDAMWLASDLVEWNGASMCDTIVRHVYEMPSPSTTLSVFEMAAFQDCLTKRALGEMISVAPYMSWFPESAFYDPLAVFQLVGDAMHAYRVYRQFREDKTLPRSVVMGDTYRSEWESKGLDMSHLDDPDEYEDMVLEATLEDYFVRNNANYDLAAVALGFVNVFSDASSSIGEHYDTILSSSTMDDSSSTQAHDEAHIDALLTKEQKRSRRSWRNAASVNARRVTATSQRKRDLGAEDVLPKGHTHGYGNRTQWKTTQDARDTEFALAGTAESASLGLSMGWVRGAASGIYGRAAEWATSKARRLVSRLPPPRTPRARRNRAYVRSVAMDAVVAYEAARDDRWLPGRPLRPERVRALAENHGALAAGIENVGIDARTTTGLVRADSNHEPFCYDVDVIPVCFDCAIVDGLLREIVLAAYQVSDYYTGDNGGEFPLNLQAYLDTDDYITSSSVRTCGGDGTQPLHWPSTTEILPGATGTDILGAPDGAIRGFIDYLADAIPTDSNATSTTRGMALMARDRFFPCPRCDRIERALRDRGMSPIAEASAEAPNYAEDYAATHGTFDPTYAVTKIFDVTDLLVAIDDLGDLTLSLDFNVTFETPFNETNSIPLPVLSGDGDAGYLGRFLETFLFTDYEYTCSRRLLSPGQIFVFAITIGLIVLYVYEGTAELIPVGLRGMVGMNLLLGWLLVIVVIGYQVPATNLLMNPLSVPPSCAGADAVDVTLCSLAPRCQSFLIAGLDAGPRGDYNEATCDVCPYERPVINCKRDLGIRHVGDAIVALLQWLVPDIYASLRVYLDPFDALFEGGGIDLDRFDGVDFGDPQTIDRFASCLIVMSPVYAANLIIYDIFLTVVVGTALLVLLPLAASALIIILFALLALFAMAWVIIFNTMFVTTPADLQSIEGLYYDEQTAVRNSEY